MKDHGPVELPRTFTVRSWLRCTFPVLFFGGGLLGCSPQCTCVLLVAVQDVLLLTVKDLWLT